MAKIIIQTNAGEEIKAINANDHNLRNCAHSLLSVSGIINEILRAVEEALDRDEDSERPTDPTMRIPNRS